MYSMAFVFGILVGPLMDKFGRRKVFIVTLWATAAGSILTGVETGFVMLIIFQMIISAGATSEMSSGVVMVSETQEAKRRNFVLGIAQNGYPLGFFLAALVTQLIVPNLGWRSIFFVGVVPIVIILIMRQGVGETDRFKKLQEAIKEDNAPEANAAEKAQELHYKVNTEAAKKNPFAQLFARDLRRTTISMSLWQIFSYFGTGSIIMFLPMVLAYYELGTESVWTVTLFTTALAFAGYTFTAWLTRKFPAKVIIVIFTLLAGIAGIRLAFFADDLTSITTAYATFYFFGLGQFGAAPGIWTESFPTRIRGTGTAWCGGIAFLGYIFPGIVMPILFREIGVPNSVFLWCSVCLWIASISLMFMKSIPAGTELEEIAT
jgi:MFS family permease